MAGILDMDPQAQGLLATALAALQASGPSRTPVSLGQVVGQAGEAGMGAYSTAKKSAAEAEAKAVALKKAQLDLALQQQMQSANGGGMLGATADPDAMEAIGTKLSIAGHPGGAALINAAQKIRAKKAAEAQLATMKSVAPVQPDPQEFEQSADQGTPQPVANPGRPGIFGSLAGSKIPQIAAQAQAAQTMLNAQPDAASVSPQHWLDQQGKLATQEATLTQRDSNLAPSVHVVKDSTSSTGWSYKDMRSGKITSKDAPPPATSMMNNNEVIPAAHKDMHGADYLATLPTGMSNLVKDIAEGRQTLNAASMRYGNREAIAQRVSQYDPNYNTNRPNVLKDFTSGKTSDNITAINTVIAHMGTVDKLTQAMQNGNVQAVNGAVNTIKTQLGKPEINNAEIAIQAMGNELMRVFRQVGASEHETKAWEAKFNALKGSPEQLAGALKVGAELVKGRLDAVNDKWKRGMNVETDFPKIISPDSMNTLRRLGVKVGSDATPASPDQLNDLLKKYGRKPG